MHNPTMGGLILESCHLRTPFRTYEQFVHCFCNVFLIGIVRNPSWNDAKLEGNLRQSSSSVAEKIQSIGPSQTVDRGTQYEM